MSERGAAHKLKLKSLPTSHRSGLDVWSSWSYLHYFPTLDTCTSNKNQHLGQLHNTYVIKSHIKEEMVEAHCLETKMKANKAVEEERWAAKGKESIAHIVEYEEKLG